MDCKPSYLSYSLGLLSSKVKEPTCNNLTEGYIHHLIRTPSIELIGGKATRIEIHLEPCQQKVIYLDGLGIDQLVALLINVECGKAIFSLDGESFMPLTTFFLDLGRRQCGPQFITKDTIEPTNLWLKNISKEDMLEAVIVAVGL
jgi:hypothetical protein